MLRKFSVENFKPFEGKFVFDLTKSGNYEFGLECVKDGIVSKGAIYGVNGIGKSNLGLALFDIVNTLTEKHKDLVSYENFINFNSEKVYATFEYEFVFDGHVLSYTYEKSDVNVLSREVLKIDNTEYIYYDFLARRGYSKFEGSETLNLNDMSRNSRVKFIMNSAILAEDNLFNNVLIKFKDFVNRMLLFYSLRKNEFIGYKESPDVIDTLIISANRVEEFERFLNKHGLNIRLTIIETLDGKKSIGVQYKNGVRLYYDVASTGMVSLALFYSWFISLEQCSFVIIDEFDAFYHYELAEDIVEMLKNIKGTQIFVTTHNTDLLSNELLRPDCYYVLTDKKIDSLNHLTEKDLRFAHNLQKMFKANAFKEE